MLILDCEVLIGKNDKVTRNFAAQQRQFSFSRHHCPSTMIIIVAELLQHYPCIITSASLHLHRYDPFIPSASFLLHCYYCTITSASLLLHHDFCTMTSAPWLLHHDFCTMTSAQSLHRRFILRWLLSNELSQMIGVSGSRYVQPALKDRSLSTETMQWKFGRCQIIYVVHDLMCDLIPELWIAVEPDLFHSVKELRLNATIIANAEKDLSHLCSPRILKSRLSC